MNSIYPKLRLNRSIIVVLPSIVGVYKPIDITHKNNTVNSNIISVSFFFRTMRSYLPSLDVFNVTKYLNMNEANNKKKSKKKPSEKER
jgi:hypothetical protein